MQTPSRRCRCRSKNHIHAGDTYIQARQDNTIDQVYIMEHKALLHPTTIKKMKTFRDVEGKMGPMPASQFRPPLPDTNPNIRKDNAMEKRKRAAPKKFRPSTAAKPTIVHLPATVSKDPAINDVPDPHLWRMFQFVRALHGLAQVKCWVTFLKTEIGYSIQTIWTMKIRMKM